MEHGKKITVIDEMRELLGRVFWWCKSHLQKDRVDFEMACDPADGFDEKFQSRTFAPELVLALRQILRKGDWVIDAGAQKGYITLHAAKLIGKAGRVFSFEPDPRSKKILEENCSLNSLTNVKIIGSALGDCSAVRPLKLSSQLGWTSFYPNERNRHTTIGQQEIVVSTMDNEILPELNGTESVRIAMVKIDCEGSEPEILRGMRSLLMSFSPLIWVEINTGSLKAAGSSEQEVLNLLSEQQYEIYLPRINTSKLRTPALSLSPFMGDPADESHRVFDVVAIRKPEAKRLTRYGVLFE